MKLTVEERTTIAQRAAGSYVVNAQVARISRDHKKNKEPGDQIFLEFARLVQGASFSIKEYERLQRAILSEIPHPHGTPWIETEPAGSRKPPTQATVVKASRKTKGQRKCGICGLMGHNARTCSSKPDTPTVKHTDGIERLTPGFDPNPPSGQVNEEDDDSTGAD